MQFLTKNGIEYYADDFIYYKKDEITLDLSTKINYKLYELNDELECGYFYFESSLYKANDLTELTNIYKSLAKDYLDDGNLIKGLYKSYQRLPYINIKGKKIDKTIAETINGNQEAPSAINFENYIKELFNINEYAIYDVSLYDKYIECCPFDSFYILIKAYVIFINGYAILLEYGSNE